MCLKDLSCAFSDEKIMLVFCQIVHRIQHAIWMLYSGGQWCCQHPYKCVQSSYLAADVVRMRLPSPVLLHLQSPSPHHCLYRCWHIPVRCRQYIVLNSLQTDIGTSEQDALILFISLSTYWSAEWECRTSHMRSLVADLAPLLPMRWQGVSPWRSKGGCQLRSS